MACPHANHSNVFTHEPRIEISFDRELAALRAVADAVGRVGRPHHARPNSRETTGPAVAGSRPSPRQGNVSRALLSDSLLAPTAWPQIPQAARYLESLASAFGPLDPQSDRDATWPLVDLLVLDASALAALARGNRLARLHLSRAIGSLARIVVPVTSLSNATNVRVAESVGDVVGVDVSTARDAARAILATRCVEPETALAVAMASHGPVAAILTAEATTAQAYARALRTERPYVFAV